jgi:SPP1 family predicted phage head-tail adaptor
VRAGELNRRITVLRPVETRSDSGEVVTSYEPDSAIGDNGRVWAQILPLSGSRYLAAEQLDTRVTHEVRVRYQDGYRDNRWIAWEAEPGIVQTLSVVAVLPIAADRARLSLMCELRGATGWR